MSTQRELENMTIWAVDTDGSHAVSRTLLRWNRRADAKGIGALSPSGVLVDVEQMKLSVCLLVGVRQHILTEIRY